MNDMFLIGIRDAFEKIARSNVKPLALARTLEEGLLSPTMRKKFKVSPGEMRRAEKIREHARRKAMRTSGVGKKTTEEALTQTTQRIKSPVRGTPAPTRMTPSQVVRERRMQYLTGTMPQGTAVARPSAMGTRPSAIYGGQPATVVGRPSAAAMPGARTLQPPSAVPKVDLARKRMFSTPASMMQSPHAPGSLGAIKHVFAAWMR